MQKPLYKTQDIWYYIVREHKMLCRKYRYQKPRKTLKTDENQRFFHPVGGCVAQHFLKNTEREKHKKGQDYGTGKHFF